MTTLTPLRSPVTSVMCLPGRAAAPAEPQLGELHGQRRTAQEETRPRCSAAHVWFGVAW